MALACIAFSAPSFSAPYELTIYSDEIPKQGESEVELTFSLAKPRPDDDVPEGRVGQALLEYSYGVAPGWGVGIELPVAHADGSSKLKGLKGELQYVAPHEATGAYWGVRCDLGYESSVYEARGGNGADINPIFGYRWSSWHLVVNPSLEIPLGGESKKTEFRPAAHLVTSVGAMDAIGVEYYANMGPVSKFLPHRKRDEMVYLVWDKRLGAQLLSLGLGQPLNSSSGNADRWVVKATLSLDMD